MYLFKPKQSTDGLLAETTSLASTTQTPTIQTPPSANANRFTFFQEEIHDFVSAEKMKRLN
jgi:hypothetical protein